MNKKAITAIENKKLLKNIKKNNNIKFIYKNIQYREAIIEILKKEKDIGIIFISEDIPGEISIEELINEIKLINKKIEIIFFLNKKNKNKEEKLKKIKVNKIYYIKKINNKFKIDYKFCIINNECYVSYEYIVPDFRNNYDKTILKIVGNINLKESNIKTDSLFQFINNYGTIVYEIKGVSKRQNISLVEIKPSKTSLKDTYYIEILNEIQNAESISLEFNLRNNRYIYKLK